MSATPTMMTIREIARTGLLSEHALRLLLKEGKLPAIYVGNKALVNYDKLCEQASQLRSRKCIDTTNRNPIGRRNYNGKHTHVNHVLC